MTLDQKDVTTLGAVVPDWCAPPAPTGAPLTGRYAALEALDADAHAAALFKAFDRHDALWDYMPYGPFATAQAYHRWVDQTVRKGDPLFYAIRDLHSGLLGGVASYLRIDRANGTIEVGHINFGPQLQRTRAATEAIFLMMEWAFSAGYRRFEWKCNALNLPSRRAAQRFGFSYEGVFRQAVISKGRNRDTAWFAMIDAEWPALRTAFERWLAPQNFDADGRQKQALGTFTTPVRVADDPAL
ncbi:GNAT family protein [uncultured Roseobacter sp.]|uniref:GNAT family N-acetyltransferase n=1 Tax=uncultured Roseobacter sp. TaxID=114847 RepID=UPI00262264EE|nr:GNAT family protein [uncultured Roseobacter sp.]